MYLHILIMSEDLFTREVVILEEIGVGISNETLDVTDYNCIDGVERKLITIVLHRKRWKHIN